MTWSASPSTGPRAPATFRSRPRSRTPSPSSAPIMMMSGSASSVTTSPIPPAITVRRCTHWWKARFFPSLSFSCFSKIGARPSLRRWPCRYPSFRPSSRWSFSVFSLNILSLLAITLVTGILVDDAIVEIENVVRHRNMGKSAYRAAMDASDEIGLAVIAISATIIAVFAPVGMMSGVVGLYFREFGLTVAIAVFFSLLVARLITPILAAYFMTGSPPVEAPKGLFISAYERLLRFSLRWRWGTVGAAIASFALAMMALLSVPTAFLPEEDIGQLTLSIELPPGATIEETRAVTDDVSRRILRFEEVEAVFVQAGVEHVGATGRSLCHGAGRSHAQIGTLAVVLRDRSRHGKHSRLHRGYQAAVSQQPRRTRHVIRRARDRRRQGAGCCETGL